MKQNKRLIKCGVCRKMRKPNRPGGVMCVKCIGVLLKSKEDDKDKVTSDGYIMLVKGDGPKGLFKQQTVAAFKSCIEDVVYPLAAFEDEVGWRANYPNDNDEDSDRWKNAAGYNDKVEERFIVLAYATWGNLGMKRIYDTGRDTYRCLFSPRFKQIVDEYRKNHDYLSDGD